MRDYAVQHVPLVYGDLGSSSTVGLLEELAQGPETRVRVAATAALVRLKKRVGI